MNILITGGTGFIGTPLTKRLKDEGHNLLLVVRKIPKIQEPGIQYLKIHISNIKSKLEDIQRFNPKVALHLAWEGLPDYSFEMGLKNLKYGIQVVNTIAKTNCQKMIITGSCWEYLNKNGGKMLEDSPLDHRSPFAGSKNALHEYATHTLSSARITLVWARLFYVYGPKQKQQSIIPTCIQNIKDNKSTEVLTPEAKLDYIYIDDVIDALSCLTNYCYVDATYNIGTGYSISIKEIVDLLYTLSNKRNNVIYSNNGFDICYYADISKMKLIHGWSPTIGIKEGLRRVINE